MNSKFNPENLIIYLKSKKRLILIFSLILWSIIVSYVYFIKLSDYTAQVKFYITNSGLINYETVLKKDFIDISVEKNDLSRLQSFGHSNALLLDIIDSIEAHKAQINPSLIKELDKSDALHYIGKLYKVSVTDLDEIEVTAKCGDAYLSNFLCYQVMGRVNALNNSYLSEFKEEQILANERKISLLNDEKNDLVHKVKDLSSKIRETDYLTNIKKFEKKINSNLLTNEEVQEYIIEISNPEKLALSNLIHQLNLLNESIDVFNRALGNDRWSVEMIKKKKPYITQNKNAKKSYSLVGLVIIIISNLIISFAIILISFSLYLRYEKYIKMIFS